jgi:hypothetical protein
MRHAGALTGPFQQDPGKLAAVEQNIIGPFQRKGPRQTGQRDAGIAQGQRIDEDDDGVGGPGGA